MAHDIRDPQLFGECHETQRLASQNSICLMIDRCFTVCGVFRSHGKPWRTKVFVALWGAARISGTPLPMHVLVFEPSASMYFLLLRFSVHSEDGLT
jgi:hypothetical protein